MRKIYYNRRKLHWNKKRVRRGGQGKKCCFGQQAQSEWNEMRVWVTDWMTDDEPGGKSVSERASEWVGWRVSLPVTPQQVDFPQWMAKGGGCSWGVGKRENLARWRVIQFGQQRNRNRTRATTRSWIRIWFRNRNWNSGGEMAETEAGRSPAEFWLFISVLI